MADYENILPVGPYLRQVRLPIAFALIFAGTVGVAFRVLLILSPSPTERLPSGGLTEHLLWGLGGGLACGAAFCFALWIRLRFLVRRQYEGHLAFGAPAPEGGNFTHRLVAIREADTWIQRTAGVLYAGPGQVIFVPEVANLPSNRHQSPLAVGPRTTFTPGQTKPEGLLKFFGARPLPTLEIRSGQDSLLLRVPEPETVATALAQVCLRS